MSGRVTIGSVNPWPVAAALRCCDLLLGLLLAVSLVSTSVRADEPDVTPRREAKHVLLLHSFGREFRPWSEYARSIKAELERQSPWPLDIQEHKQLTARFNNPGPEAPFIEYLALLYQGTLPDIVISIGAPAARFVQRYRSKLFPGTPTVLTVLELRLVNRFDLTDDDVVVSVRNDFMAAFKNILQVMPDTKTVAVVVGASPLHSTEETTRKTVDATIRILGGEKPSSIKYEPIGFAAPKYDWRELQRRGVSESNLPAGSEIVFREPTVWESHRWQMLLIAAIILVQAGLISGLLSERHRRQVAEVESRQRLAELAHANRYSAVGELTASIAHELNQPLGSILTNAETAELMLKDASPDLDEIRHILADIRRDDQRASEVIRRLRSVLRKSPFEIRNLELNGTVSEAIGLAAAVAAGRRIALSYVPAISDLPIKGDPVQIQQVILNLIINAMDAISDADMKKREVSVTTFRTGNQAEIRIVDTGPGIAAEDLANVFNPFFTTKPEGMGMGLAIAKTIVEAHHGTMSAENVPAGGAQFTVRLPIVR